MLSNDLEKNEKELLNNVKAYWNKQPCNIKHSDKSSDSKEFFEEIRKKRYFVEPHILEFMELDKCKNKRVLEIGTGVGSDAYCFATNDAEYTGIDLSDKSLEMAKKCFEINNLKGQFYNLNAEEMTIFNNDYFDIVYSFGVIHHTVNPEKIVEEVYRILKPGGVFKLMLYATNSLKKIMINDNLDQYEAQSGTPIANTYTKEEVHELLNKYNDIHINQTHIFPYNISEYKKHNYIKEKHFEFMDEKLFNCLKKNLGWHLCITCKK